MTECRRTQHGIRAALMQEFDGIIPARMRGRDGVPRRSPVCNRLTSPNRVIERRCPIRREGPRIGVTEGRRAGAASPLALDARAKADNRQNDDENESRQRAAGVYGVTVMSPTMPPAKWPGSWHANLVVPASVNFQVSEAVVPVGISIVFGSSCMSIAPLAISCSCSV